MHAKNDINSKNAALIPKLTPFQIILKRKNMNTL